MYIRWFNHLALVILSVIPAESQSLVIFMKCLGNCQAKVLKDVTDC